ncbi:MAG TPA: AAA family ATPase [Kofleriaceae bacterium]|nr:AAA family ATPase [Kofleriaceae bacterium]
MNVDLETLLKHLSDGTGRVELDLPSPQSSASVEVAAKLARERRTAIGQGIRTAHLYVAPGFSKALSLRVTEGESQALLGAGAIWVGPDIYAPRPVHIAPTRMLQRFELHDLKAHHETVLQLSRLTMLVGDNASGKTSVLDALALQGSLLPPFEDVVRGAWAIPNLIRRGAPSKQATLVSSGIHGGDDWTATLHLAQTDEQKYAIAASTRVGQVSVEAHANGERQGGRLGFGFSDGWESIRAVIGPAAMYRLRAEQIANAAYSYAPEVRVKADGTNTAVVLAAMKLGDDERFEIVEEAMRRLVPSLERVRIRPEVITEELNGISTPHRGSKIYFDFQGAKDIPADGASHGTLILLSLLTVLYGPARPALVLIDDLEQALHPRAQRELVQLLKELLTRPEFSDLQIVATTHSPYSIDLMDPSEVYALALRDDGSVASKRLSEHPDAEKMKGSLTAGQLWSLDEERTWVLG